jgi:hypothetical protein
MKILVEEHPLVTPDFVGTDAEKTCVLSYWADIIGKLRAMNTTVIFHRNKLVIIAQLKKELELIDIEINNNTAHPTVHTDGSTEMAQDIPKEEPKDTIDLAEPEVQLISPSGAPNPTIPPAQKSPLYAPPKMSMGEQMQRLSGTWYINEAKRAKAKKAKL